VKKYIVALTVNVTVEAVDSREAEKIAWKDAWKLIGTPHAATVTLAQFVREDKS
jgi:hypothetical protein